VNASAGDAAGRGSTVCVAAVFSVFIHHRRAFVGWLIKPA
jgi:hypothetical protein